MIESMLFKVIAAALLVAAVVFGIHKLDLSRQQIGYDRAVGEYKDQLIAAKDAADLKELGWKQRVKEAEENGTKEAKDLQRRFAAATAVSRSLRDTIATYRDSLPGSSIEAARAAADTGLQLLGQCQSAYLELAGKADGHVADIKRMKAQWPE